MEDRKQPCVLKLSSQVTVLDIKDFTYHVSLDKLPREQVICN